MTTVFEEQPQLPTGESWSSGGLERTNVVQSILKAAAAISAGAILVIEYLPSGLIGSVNVGLSEKAELCDSPSSSL